MTQKEDDQKESDEHDAIVRRPRSTIGHNDRVTKYNHLRAAGFDHFEADQFARLAVKHDLEIDAPTAKMLAGAPVVMMGQNLLATREIRIDLPARVAEILPTITFTSDLPELKPIVVAPGVAAKKKSKKKTDDGQGGFF